MRRTMLVLIVGILFGAMLMAAVPGGAVGQSFLLGQKNTEKVVTRLNTRGGLRIDSFKSGNPPLILNTTDVLTPPMQVNSHALVPMLNADFVDGLSSNSLRSGWAWLSNDNIPDDQNWSSTERTVNVSSSGGVILMNGSVDFYNNKAGADWVNCAFYVDGTILPASEMTAYAQGYQTATCHSTAAKEFGSGGDHTVKFLTTGMSLATIEAGDGTWWVIMLPS